MLKKCLSELFFIHFRFRFLNFLECKKLNFKKNYKNKFKKFAVYLQTQKENLYLKQKEKWKKKLIKKRKDNF